MNGSLEDRAFLKKAFQGADRLFLMIPPHYQAEDFRAYQNRIIDAYLDAIQSSSDIHYIVTLSSLGAHHDNGTGPILGLHDLETRMAELKDRNIVHLRPTFFMENLLITLPMIRNSGIAGTPMRGDIEVPMIATADIASKAADLLMGEPVSGHSIRELLGPRDYTQEEAVSFLGKALGIDGLSYIQIPYKDAKHSMMEQGFSESVADAMIELNKSVNEGRIIVGTTRTPANTTSTTLESFISNAVKALT